MQLTVDGHRVHAYTGGHDWGDGQPLVVFVHGAGMDHTVWLLQSRWFAHHGYNVLALDLPGHGRSAGPALESIGALADWVVASLDRLETGPATLVGHSMGALVALDAAARHPRRAAAVALLGAGAAMPVSAALLDAARADDHAAFDMINLWGHSGAAQITANPAPGMWMSGAALRLLERSRAGVLYTDLAACNAYTDAPARAAMLECELLVLGARADRMTPPAAAAALAEAAGGARLVTVDAGHMMMTEAPDQVLDALAAFVAATAAGD